MRLWSIQVETPASATAAAITAQLDCGSKFCAKPDDFRLVVCLLGIRQQPFKFVDTFLKVHSLFKIHDYFTLSPSL